MITKGLSLEELEYEIDELRKCMTLTGYLKGLSHPETIKISQELDILLNEHLKRTSESS